MQNTLQPLLKRFGMNIKAKRQYLGQISPKKTQQNESQVDVLVHKSYIIMFEAVNNTLATTK